MDAGRLIQKSEFEPETLHVVFKAFDAAWAEIAHHFNGDAEEARLRLAEAILSVVCEDAGDAKKLKNDGLQKMALADRPLHRVHKMG